MKLSIIISTYNEMAHGYFQKIHREISGIPNAETIIVDGGSQDNTTPYAKECGAKVISLPKSTRGTRLHVGAQQSTGKLLLFHHPRTYIKKADIVHLITHKKTLTWGGFTHCFDQDTMMAKFTSWYSNKIRAKKQHILYLDHGIFVNAKLYEKSGGFPSFPIFEDTELSKRLRRIHKPTLLPKKCLVSAIRFNKNGWVYQGTLNQLMKLGYTTGIDTKKLYKIYEHGLWLN